MSALNLTALSNINGFYDMGNITMALTSNMFFLVIVIMIYIVVIWKMLPRYDIASGMAVASFIALLLSLPLYYLQWVAWFIPIFFIFALAGSLFMVARS